MAPLVVVAAGIGAVHAQSPSKDKPDISVVVTASRGNTTLEEMPLYTTVITQEQIQRSPGQTLDQLLR
jgi:outer membrane cobalamin receptor